MELRCEPVCKCSSKVSSNDLTTFFTRVLQSRVSIAICARVTFAARILRASTSSISNALLQYASILITTLFTALILTSLTSSVVALEPHHPQMLVATSDRQNLPRRT